MITLLTSLTNHTALLRQPCNFSCYITIRILVPLQLGIQTLTDLRTVSRLAGSLTLPSHEGNITPAINIVQTPVLKEQMSEPL